MCFLIPWRFVTYCPPPFLGIMVEGRTSLFSYWITKYRWQLAPLYPHKYLISKGEAKSGRRPRTKMALCPTPDEKLNATSFSLLKTNKQTKKPNSCCPPKVPWMERAQFQVDIYCLPSLTLFETTCPLHFLVPQWNSNLPPSFTDPHKIRHMFTFFSHQGWKVCCKFRLSCSARLCEMAGKGMRSVWSHGIETWRYATQVCLLICLFFFFSL